MFEDQIVLKLKEVFARNDVAVEGRLLGGMSNYTYLVLVGQERYTFRLLGDYAEYFVNRLHEKKHIELFEKMGITNKMIYFEEETGIKIAKYIEGKSLNFMQEYPYEKVAKVLKKIHNSGVSSFVDYDPFGRLSTYEGYIKRLGFVHPETYVDLKKEFFQYKSYLENQQKVLTHGDSQPSNFILTDEEMVCVDFEFSGNNDLVHDIACFGNIDFKHAKDLLEVYYKEKLTVDHKKRLVLWRMFQCFQWYNVAMFKDMQGMSAKLHIDFSKVAQNYLNKIEVLFNELALVTK